MNRLLLYLGLYKQIMKRDLEGSSPKQKIKFSQLLLNVTNSTMETESKLSNIKKVYLSKCRYGKAMSGTEFIELVEKWSCPLKQQLITFKSALGCPDLSPDEVYQQTFLYAVSQTAPVFYVQPEDRAPFTCP